MSSAPAVLFDVDGTLVDSNHLHTLAWHRAFRERGVVVPMHRIHGLIGMGSDLLIAEVLGSHDAAVDDAYSRHFSILKGDVVAFDRAADLLAAVAGRGGAVVLATSAKPEDVPTLQETIGADEDVVSHVVSSGDVERSKPAGDIFRLALERAGARPDRAIVVGDTVYDVRAAADAGLDCIALRTGGICRAELEAAGAVAVYDDPATLLEDLDGSPLAGLLTSRPGG